jgi:hypothetical protein
MIWLQSRPAHPQSAVRDVRDQRGGSNSSGGLSTGDCSIADSGDSSNKFHGPQRAAVIERRNTGRRQCYRTCSSPFRC